MVTSALRLVLQRLDNSVVGRMSGEVLKPQERSTLTREDIGNPAERVIEIPDGNADAAPDLDASANRLR
jgi:hypothetical protein